MGQTNRTQLAGPPYYRGPPSYLRLLLFIDTESNDVSSITRPREN